MNFAASESYFLFGQLTCKYVMDEEIVAWVQQTESGLGEDRKESGWREETHMKRSWIGNVSQR